MGIHWDGTVTLGTIMTMITIIGTMWVAYFAFVRRIEIQIAVYGTMLSGHGEHLKVHDQKFEKVDERMKQHEEDTTEIVGVVQRLVGRSDIELDRRVSTPRRHKDLG
jgi:hypothetical protein